MRMFVSVMIMLLLWLDTDTDLIHTEAIPISKPKQLKATVRTPCMACSEHERAPTSDSISSRCHYAWCTLHLHADAAFWAVAWKTLPQTMVAPIDLLNCFEPG